MSNEQEIISGILRAEAGNNPQRALNWSPKHKVSLGPGSKEHPSYCLNCGKLREHWGSIYESCAGGETEGLWKKD